MLCIESHVLGSSTECLSVGNVRVPGLDALDLVPAKRAKDRATFDYKIILQPKPLIWPSEYVM